MAEPSSVFRRMSSLSLAALPAHIRAALYSLPLFITWLLPLVVRAGQEEPGVLRAARRSLGLFLVYMALLIGSYVLSGLIEILTGPGHFAVNLTIFLLRSLSGLGYLGVSLYLTRAEYLQKPAPAARLDTLVEKITKLISL